MIRENNNHVEKFCYTCQQWLNIDEFHKSKEKKDGRVSKCKLCTHKKRKDYYHANKKESLKKSNEWRDKNKDRVNELKRKRNQLPENKKKNAAYMRTKKQKDPIFKLRCNFSTLVYSYLKNNNKTKNNKRFEELVGYTINDLKIHLEKQFIDGMNWDNYGQWHVDHIIPQSSFNFNISFDEEFKKCWALENLQPLWAIDNIKKSNKIA